MGDGSAADAGRPSERVTRPERRSQKAPDPLIGRVINDRFRIVSLIARGGMGKVYRAEQAPLGREVALKILNPNYSGDADPEFHKRFFLEASTCAKLTHPNTITIFDYGRTDDEVYYIAMELLKGRTLYRALRDDGPMRAPQAMHVARQICRSLREAHALGMIHRDLKPANIFLVQHGDESDFVKVLDFGLVKDIGDTGEDLTQTGLFMGSPKYISPEQIRGEGVDARTDIYALGVILYETICGKVPFDRPNSVNILMAHVHEAPPPILEANPAAEIPILLGEVVMKALEKEPDARFESMDEMLVALKHVAAGSGPSITRGSDLRQSDVGSVGIAGRFGASSEAPPAIITGETGAEGPIASHPPPSFDFTIVQTRSKLPTVIAIVGSLALALAALVALVAGSGPDELPPPTTEQLPGTPAPSGDPGPQEPPRPPVRTTMVVLRSTPPGATVNVGDTAIGQTPTDVEWSGDDAELGRRVTFVFQLDGYRDYSVTRVITRDRLEVAATLEEIRRAPRPSARRRRRGGRRTQDRGGDQVAPIKGYKLDPY